jgi:hypothetical protein
MRASVLRLAGAGLLVLALAAPAHAAGGGKVVITLDSNFVQQAETFTAVGAFCDHGTAFTPDIHFAGGRGQAFTFHLQKVLICYDGDTPTGDTLTILINAATTAGSPTDQGGWSVVSGTGAYAGAGGGGSVVGTYYSDGVVDRYTGVING